ncbi:MAG: hypothetical protein PVH19_03815 [Planctomycetia bacterium]|jgi:hypothetical protein
MTRLTIIAFLGLMVGGFALAESAQAFEGFFATRRAMRKAERDNWHQGYYQGQWGAPLAVVVPPTVDMQTTYRSTVGGTQVTRIWPQYKRGYPGDPTPSMNGNRYKPVPRWPSSTNQMGVYYIRGPW